MFGLKIVKSDTIYKLRDNIFDLNYQNRDLQNDVNRLLRDNKDLSDEIIDLRNQNGILIEKVNRLEIENRKLLNGTKQNQQQVMQQQALADIATAIRQNNMGLRIPTPDYDRFPSVDVNVVTKNSEQYSLTSVADTLLTTHTPSCNSSSKISSGRASSDNSNISASDLYIAASQSEAPVTKSKSSSYSSSSDSSSSPSDSYSYSSYSDNSSSSSSCSSDSGSSSSCGGD